MMQKKEYLFNYQIQTPGQSSQAQLTLLIFILSLQVTLQRFVKKILFLFIFYLKPILHYLAKYNQNEALEHCPFPLRNTLIWVKPKVTAKEGTTFPPCIVCNQPLFHPISVGCPTEHQVKK